MNFLSDVFVFFRRFSTLSILMEKLRKFSKRDIISSAERHLSARERCLSRNCWKISVSMRDARCSGRIRSIVNDWLYSGRKLHLLRESRCAPAPAVSTRHTYEGGCANELFHSVTRALECCYLHSQRNSVSIIPFYSLAWSNEFIVPTRCWETSKIRAQRRAAFPRIAGI